MDKTINNIDELLLEDELTSVDFEDESAVRRFKLSEDEATAIGTFAN